MIRAVFTGVVEGLSEAQGVASLGWSHNCFMEVKLIFEEKIRLEGLQRWQTKPFMWQSRNCHLQIHC